MLSKILLVDDDEAILAGYQRNLRRRFDLDLAVSGDAALALVGAETSYAVIVADMHMPGMNGLDFLKKAMERSPETTRIMITGDADQRTAADAVNHGQVFRFLAKPCLPEELYEAITAGVRQNQLVRAEKDLLEQTLSGAVEAMTDLLAVVDPKAFGSAQLLKYRAVRVARILKAEREWEIGLAALLSPLGRLTISPRLLQRASPLKEEERALLERVPEFGARLIRRIPRLEQVAEMVLYQAKGFDGSGFPFDSAQGSEIPFGAFRHKTHAHGHDLFLLGIEGESQQVHAVIEQGHHYRRIQEIAAQAALEIHHGQTPAYAFGNEGIDEIAALDGVCRPAQNRVRPEDKALT